MFKCVVHLCLHMCGHVSHMHVHVEAEVDARSHPGLCSHLIYWGRVSQPWAHRTWLVSLVSLLWGAPVSDFLWLGLWAGHQASLALRLWGPEPDPCTFLANTQTTSTSSQPHLPDSQVCTLTSALCFCLDMPGYVQMCSKLLSPDFQKFFSQQ